MPAQTTASEMCWGVVGKTITTGVYGRRKLYGWASWAKLGEEMRLIGMFLSFKQSVRVVLAVGVAEDVVDLDMVDDNRVTEDGELSQLPNADWHPDPQ